MSFYLSFFLLPQVLNDFNTVPVTRAMDSTCTSQWPDYETTRPC